MTPNEELLLNATQKREAEMVDLSLSFGSNAFELSILDEQSVVLEFSIRSFPLAEVDALAVRRTLPRRNA